MALAIETATLEVIDRHIDRVRAALAGVRRDLVERIVDTILEAHRAGRHVYILGNGGSASTASHFACDLSKATITEGRSRLRVSSLSDNAALLTAWANDTSYDRVFAEQLLALVVPGDVVIAVSASGNSPNLLRGAEAAHQLGAAVIALVGFSGGQLLRCANVAVHIPVDDYGVVEDCHLVLEHAITEAVRRRLTEAL